MERKIRSDSYYDTKEDGYRYLKGLKGRIQNNIEGALRVLFTAVAVLMQFILVLILPLFLQSLSIYFYFALEICSVMTIVLLINKNQSPSFKMAWISIVLLFPISGFILYYFWGREGGKKKEIDLYILRQFSYGNKFLYQDEEVLKEYISNNPVSGRMVKYMINEGFPLRDKNSVKFYSMGEDAFEDIIRALKKAQEYIFLDFFIVAEGALWDKVHDILIDKAKNGIEVKFLYDDFGAAIRTRKYFKENLESEGIEVRVFNPIHKYTGELYMNYRSHQKIVVVDGKIGFTGGFNLADEYANLIERFGVWKDTGVAVKGDAVWDLTVIFLKMWEVCGNNEKNHIDYLKYKRLSSCDGSTYCQVISDGPAQNPQNSIESIYNQMITFSDEYLYMTTPYLVLEDYMQQSIIEAVNRGVDVRIVTPHIPDKKYAKMLTNYYYGRLLKSGVRIYEYTPGFIHAKQILTENAAIVGTINIDYRSFYLHYENGIWMSGNDITEKVKEDFNITFSQSNEITYEDWLNRPRIYKIIQPILNLFSTLF